MGKSRASGDVGGLQAADIQTWVDATDHAVETVYYPEPDNYFPNDDYTWDQFAFTLLLKNVKVSFELWNGPTNLGDTLAVPSTRMITNMKLAGSVGLELEVGSTETVYAWDMDGNAFQNLRLKVEYTDTDNRAWVIVRMIKK